MGHDQDFLVRMLITEILKRIHDPRFQNVVLFHIRNRTEFDHLDVVLVDLFAIIIAEIPFDETRLRQDCFLIRQGFTDHLRGLIGPFQGTGDDQIEMFIVGFKIFAGYFRLFESMLVQRVIDSSLDDIVAVGIGFSVPDQGNNIHIKSPENNYTIN